MKEIVKGKNLVVFSSPNAGEVGMVCVGREARMYADSLTKEEVVFLLDQIKRQSLKECYFLDNNKVYVIDIQIDDLKLIFN